MDWILEGIWGVIGTLSAVFGILTIIYTVGAHLIASDTREDDPHTKL